MLGAKESSRAISALSSPAPHQPHQFDVGGRELGRRTATPGEGAEHAGQQLRGDQRLAVVGDPDGLDEQVRGVHLEQKAAGPGLQCRAHGGFIAERGEAEGPRRLRQAQRLLDQFDAVHSGHVYISEQDVRGELSDQAQRTLAVGRHTDDRNVGSPGQVGDDRTLRERIVLGHHDPDL